MAAVRMQTLVNKMYWFLPRGKNLKKRRKNVNATRKFRFKKALPFRAITKPFYNNKVCAVARIPYLAIMFCIKLNQAKTNLGFSYLAFW
ncbi:hypothetical protein GGTG_05163 [Gaeumannomyces tritici R3-111a-1]|uniref:Uncharacterized protein n=1 Tax=Gaeumannomyces tritici (strain R3-111a-1) TaxID=644352 RepID=J3NV50_GAET3|nr:hypothetical protein GGTG_05163 [Gaeumannomyces tritici R3-111a-1]EJT75226.1 hypothetical protein GGTG_05163 [Gaeumannomyces tritici R3-111a-1]